MTFCPHLIGDSVLDGPKTTFSWISAEVEALSIISELTNMVTQPRLNISRLMKPALQQ